MNRRVLCLIFIILLSHATEGVSGAEIDSALFDTSSVRQTDIPEGFFSEFLSDPDFEYSAEVNEQAGTLVENFVRWLIAQLDLQEKHFELLLKIIRVLLWILAIGILLFTFFKMRFYKYFYTKEEPPKKDFRIEKTEEEIENLEERIKQELSKKNFREAMRFQFLNVLRHLDENGIINYSSEKTNIDYLHELRKLDNYYASPFEILVNIYNAVWYGNFHIDETDYNQLSGKFSEFNRMIHAKA